MATYKCPNCYDIEVTGQAPGFFGNDTRDYSVVIRTEGGLPGQAITTKVISQTK